MENPLQKNLDILANKFNGMVSPEIILEKTSKNAAKIFRLLFFIVISFIILYPLIYMVSMTFRSPSDLNNPAVIWIPQTFTLENLKDAFTMMNAWKAYLNTIEICVVTALIQIVPCSLAGYGFARFKFKFKDILFALVLFTIIVPPAITYIPTYHLYRRFDFMGLGKVAELLTGNHLSISFIDTPWAMYFPAIFAMGIRSGLLIFIFRQFFRGLPKELEDAAYIDGCGIFKTYVRVMAPNAMAVFLTVLLLSTVWYWNDYSFTSLYFNSKLTVTAALVNIPTFAKLTYSLNNQDLSIIILKVQAGCLITIAPLLVMYIFLQRYFTESIERTGIVG